MRCFVCPWVNYLEMDVLSRGQGRGIRIAPEGLLRRHVRLGPIDVEIKYARGQAIELVSGRTCRCPRM